MPQDATAALATTRQALHGVAELVLAGPQYRATRELKLHVVDGGFATAAGPDLRVDGADLVVGAHRIKLTGTYRSLAEAAGVKVGAPGSYPDGSGVGADDAITVDPVAARAIAQAFADGDHALRELAPAEDPILWPEHFDVAITVDAVNYGVSAGDGYLAEPYAYVGPHEPRTGSFFNAPFGAARPIAELVGTQELLDFFRTGRELAGPSVSPA